MTILNQGSTSRALLGSIFVRSRLYKNSWSTPTSYTNACRQHIATMDAVPQLNDAPSDTSQASEGHRQDIETMITSQNPEAVDVDTNSHDLVSSVTNMLTTLGLSTATPQGNRPTAQAMNKKLPIEIWMQVFEYVHTDDYARPSVIAVYKSAVAVYGDSIKAAETLPAFEKHTWKRLRELYHIDSNSRAAALKLHMRLRGFQDCKAPKLAMRNLAMVARCVRGGSLPETTPDCVAFEVSDQPEVLSGYKEAGRVVESLSGSWDGTVSYSLGLRTAKHIVLLEWCNWDTYSMLARAQEIECAIYEFWRRKGITAGVVEVV